MGAHSDYLRSAVVWQTSRRSFASFDGSNALDFQESSTVLWLWYAAHSRAPTRSDCDLLVRLDAEIAVLLRHRPMGCQAVLNSTVSRIQ